MSNITKQNFVWITNAKKQLVYCSVNSNAKPYLSHSSIITANHKRNISKIHINRNIQNPLASRYYLWLWLFVGFFRSAHPIHFHRACSNMVPAISNALDKKCLIQSCIKTNFAFNKNTYRNACGTFDCFDSEECRTIPITLFCYG